jgi:hypothetical protein
MAMVFGFVKQAGGYLGVKSQPGEGTTVTMTFPTTSARPEHGPQAEIVNFPKAVQRDQ